MHYYNYYLEQKYKMVNEINWSNLTDFGQMLAIPNQTTGGWFWATMMYMIFTVLVIVMSSFGIEVALLMSGFACLMLSLYLYYMGLVAWQVAGSFFGAIIFSAIYLYYSSSRT